MATGMDRYEADIAPVKKRLFSRLIDGNTGFQGRPLDVLDVGVGAGPNLRFLPPAAVRSVTGVDPNPAMAPYAAAAADQAGLAGFSFVRGGFARRPRAPPADARPPARPAAPGLPRPDTPDGLVDAVVVTLVLCSVPDPAAALEAAAAALRPGGLLLLCEHTAAPSTRPGLALVQTLLNPLQHMLADGCDLRRDPEVALRTTAGLAVESLERFEVPGGGLIAPHLASVAVKVV